MPSKRSNPPLVPIHKYPSGVWATASAEFSGMPSPLSQVWMRKSGLLPPGNPAKPGVPAVRRKTKAATAAQKRIRPGQRRTKHCGGDKGFVGRGGRPGQGRSGLITSAETPRELQVARTVCDRIDHLN